MIDGTMAKMTFDETTRMGWTQVLSARPGVLIVRHLEPTFAPTYCSPELRYYPLYMLPPIDPVVFEWPLAVAPASTSAATTPHNTPQSKPWPDQNATSHLAKVPSSCQDHGTLPWHRSKVWW